MTTAVSANFIDQSNVAETLAQGRAKLPHREVGSERHANLLAVLDALDEIDWPSVEDDLQPEDDIQRSAAEMLSIFAEHERIMYDKPVTLAAPPLKAATADAPADAGPVT